jgi:hypothetical protein
MVPGVVLSLSSQTLLERLPVTQQDIFSVAMRLAIIGAYMLGQVETQLKTMV